MLTRNEPHTHHVTRCSCGEHLGDCGCRVNIRAVRIEEEACEACRMMAGPDPFGDGGPTLDDIRGTG